ncbi:hypothetical protein [Demetria terragena]|uniref:hypothetical protein n=1 Tax=Demetria terragena TaxID=63959 RepID=UPI000364C470|nr:hypothetical protein [Demetria terragena]
MTDPFEQRLRDAFAASADSVTPKDLDPAREAEFAAAMQAEPVTESAPAGSPWPFRLAIAGLAAATIAIGSMAVGHFINDGSRPTQAEELLSPAATPSTSPGGGLGTGTETSAPSTQPSSPATQRTDRPSTTPPPARSTPAPQGSAATGTQQAAPPSSSSTSAPPTEEQPTVTSPPTHSVGSRARGSVPATKGLAVSMTTRPSGSTSATWKADARGTSGGVLKYTVRFGDGASAVQEVQGACGPDSGQQTAFSTGPQHHQYAAPGTYRVMVIVTYCTADGTATDTASNSVIVPGAP